MTEARYGAPPSGEQYEIVYGDQRGVVVQVGGGLRTYEVAGTPILDGYDLGETADGARGQTLLPWPNRIQDGSWTWDGELLQLPLAEPEQHNAIHGLVRWVGWDLVDRSESSVSLECTVRPQPGYPWMLGARNTFTLSAAGLEVRTDITNLAARRAPVACGFHPYLTVGTASIDEAIMHVPAETWLPTGDQQIPTGRAPVDGSPLDFREPRRLLATEIDHTFTDLHRDAAGRCAVTLRGDDGRSTRLWVDESYPYLEIFTGDTLSDRNRRRGLGVEPMTGPPNAFVTGESLILLEPAETVTLRWGVTGSGLH